MLDPTTLIYSEAKLGNVITKALAAMALLFAAASCQAAAATAQTSAAKTVAVTAQTSRPVCQLHGYHLRGSQRRGFTCTRRVHHKLRWDVQCQSHYEARMIGSRFGRFRCVLARHTAAPVRPTAPPQAAPVRPPTPHPVTYFTVKTVCDLDPGLGAPHPLETAFGPAAWWESAQHHLYLALSYEGDNRADAAITLRDGEIWVALCYPRESSWIKVQLAGSYPPPQGPTGSNWFYEGQNVKEFVNAISSFGS